MIDMTSGFSESQVKSGDAVTIAQPAACSIVISGWHESSRFTLVIVACPFPLTFLLQTIFAVNAYSLVPSH